MPSPIEFTASQIDATCPGLSVAARSLCWAWWTSTTKAPRKPEASDFPDAMHAVYAPYVDIFRADGFMAPHITKQARNYPVSIVPKLSQIKQIILRRLEQQE